MGKIGYGIKEGCKLAFCVCLISLPYLSTGTSKTKNYDDYGIVISDDTVKVVVSSGMYSHDKTSIIEVLKRDGDSAYYGAVIAIVKSGMYSHEKVNSIKRFQNEVFQRA